MSLCFSRVSGTECAQFFTCPYFSFITSTDWICSTASSIKNSPPIHFPPPPKGPTTSQLAPRPAATACARYAIVFSLFPSGWFGKLCIQAILFKASCSPRPSCWTTAFSTSRPTPSTQRWPYVMWRRLLDPKWDRIGLGSASLGYLLGSCALSSLRFQSKTFLLPKSHKLESLRKS